MRITAYRDDRPYVGTAAAAAGQSKIRTRSSTMARHLEANSTLVRRMPRPRHALVALLAALPLIPLPGTLARPAPPALFALLAALLLIPLLGTLARPAAAAQAATHLLSLQIVGVGGFTISY